jgi:hypothetical protein
MKRKSFSMLAAIIALLFSPTSQATVITQSVTPLDTLITVPCAAGGAGETVHVTGAAHMVFAVTQDANGGVHVATHVNTIGLSGVGLTTGAKYQAFQQDSTVLNSGGTGNEFTIINNFLMTAPGPGNNVRVHELIHGYIDASGNFIAVIDNFTSDCG